MDKINNAILEYNFRKKYEKYKKENIEKLKNKKTKFDKLYFSSPHSYLVMCLLFIIPSMTILKLEDFIMASKFEFYYLIALGVIPAFCIIVYLKFFAEKYFINKSELKKYLENFEKEKLTFSSRFKSDNFFNYILNELKILNVESLNFAHGFMEKLTEEEIEFANKINNSNFLFLIEKNVL